MNLQKDDLVVRPYNSLTLMGRVTEVSRCGRYVKFRTPEGFIFCSDAGHVEKVDVKAEQPPRKNTSVQLQASTHQS